MSGPAGSAVAPERLARVAGGQMEANPIGELPDPAADLEQPQAQGIHLSAGGISPGEPAAQGVQQPVGGGMQEQAELVRPEAVVGQAVGGQGVLEVLDEVLRLAAVDVGIV